MNKTGDKRNSTKSNPNESITSRNKIIATAKEVFISKGFENTTISLIAKKAGIGYGTVYSHFDNKADILCEIIEDTLSDVYVISSESFFPKTREEAHRIILKQTKKYLSIAVTHKRMLQVIFEAKNHSEIVNTKWENLREYFFNSVTQDITYAKNNGLTRDNLQPEIIAKVWYSCIENYLMRIVLDKETQEIDLITEQLVDFYVNGLYKPV